MLQPWGHTPLGFPNSPCSPAGHPLLSSPNSEAVFFQLHCPRHTYTVRCPKRTQPQPSHGPTLQAPPFPRLTAGPDEALLSSPAVPSAASTASGAPMVRGEVGLTCSAANLPRTRQGSGKWHAPAEAAASWFPAGPAPGRESRHGPQPAGVGSSGPHTGRGRGHRTSLLCLRGPQSPSSENVEKQTLFSLTSPITETSQRCKDMSGSGGWERGTRERHPHARHHYDGCSAEGGGCILGTLRLEGPVPFLKLQN